jgi:transcriptional regulator with XRE-family HTH domain
VREARVRELMAREGLKTLADLAEVTGVHYSTLSLWDRGKVAPSEALRERVCHAFGGRYSEDWLFPRIAPASERDAVAV